MKFICSLFIISFALVACQSSYTSIGYCYAKSIRNPDGSWSERNVELLCFPSTSECNNNYGAQDAAPVKGNCRIHSIDENTSKPIQLW